MFNACLRFTLAALLLLPIASCQKKVNPDLIGEWEANTTGKKKVYLTFAADGSIALFGDTAAVAPVLKSFAILTDFGIQPPANAITYKCLKDNKMEIEGDFSALMEKLSAGGTGKPSKDALAKLHPKDTLTYAINSEELTLTNAQGGTLKLTKSKLGP